MSDLYVPGLLHCDKCQFRLVKTNLYMGSGTFGAGDTENREVCPNEGADMRQVTWKEYAKELEESREPMIKNFGERLDAQVKDLNTLRAALEEKERECARMRTALEAVILRGNVHQSDDNYQGNHAEDCAACLVDKALQALPAQPGLGEAKERVIEASRYLVNHNGCKSKLKKGGVTSELMQDKNWTGQALFEALEALDALRAAPPIVDAGTHNEEE